MRQKIKLGVLTAVIALLALGVTASAAPASSGEAELADFDIYRTGTPDYDLVLRSSGEVGPLVLEHLRSPGGPRADGYYWLSIEENERDVVDGVIDQLQQMMGEDFPIAVSVVEVKPVPIDEAARAAVEARVAEFLDDRIFETGTPNLDLVREFYDEFGGFLPNLKYSSEFVMMGYSLDGYYELMMKEENWDVIHETVYELQQMMGDDFPVAVRIISDFERLGTAANTDTGDGTVAAATASSDVFGGLQTVIQTGFFDNQIQTLSFAAIYDGETGMVLSGHYQGEIMPVGADVYSPNSWWPWNKIGDIDHVACQHSETSYMSHGSDRIKAGVLDYGSQLPVWSPEEPQVGDWVYKTGRTTGTTLGQVLYFVDIQNGYCGILRHQCLAALDSDEGDSGAPVYSVDWEDLVPCLYRTFESGGIKVAILKGVLFGGGGGYSIFSPINQALDDLDVWPLPGPFGG